MDRNSLRRLLTPALVVAALWSVFLFWKEGIYKARDPIDFFVFYRAGERVLAGGGAYDLQLEPSRGYVYPQALAYFLARTHVPLGHTGAEWLWKSIALACLCAGITASVRWAMREVEQHPSRSDLGRIALVSTAVGLGYSPVVFGWRLGQADLIIVALLGPVLLARTPRAAWLAGMLIGVGGVLKLSPLFLLPGLFLCLGWRVAAGAMLVMFAYACWLAGNGLLMHEGLLYADRIPFFKFRNAYPASSVHGLVTALFAPERLNEPYDYYDGPLTTGTSLILCGAYAVMGLLAWRQRAGNFSLFIISMVFARLVSPFLEPHHHTPAVIPIVALGILALLRRDPAMGVWAFTAWYAGTLYLPVSEIVGGRWPALLLIASDVILLMAAWRFRHLGGEAPLAPDGGWFARLRSPRLVSCTHPRASAGDHQESATRALPPAASPSAGW